MSEITDLPEGLSELELRAKKLMTEEGYDHWSKCRAERKCCACGRPLGDKVERDCHPSCRTMTYKYKDEGHWTLESRVRDGKLGPPSRPTNPLTLEARQLGGE